MSLGETALNPATSDQDVIVLGSEPVQIAAGLKKWHYQPAVAGMTDDNKIRRTLKRHAKRAAPELAAIGQSLTSVFMGCVYEQRLKGNGRIWQKSEDRYRGNSQCILDYLAGRLRIGTLEQAMAVMDIFSKTGPTVLPGGLTVNVRDIKDKLTRASESGLPVLAVKLDIPFRDEYGAPQIHISELQFVPRQAFPEWNQSYKAYRRMRDLSADRTRLENRLGGVEVACLTPKWQRINRNVEYWAAERTRINLRARDNIPWLSALAEARQALVIPHAAAPGPELQMA